MDIFLRNRLHTMSFYFMLVMFYPLELSAQFHKASILKPSLTLGYEKMPGQDLIDTTGEFGYGSVSLNFKIPLYTHMGKASKAGSFRFYGLVLTSGGSYAWTSFSYLTSLQDLINAHAGINGIYYAGKKSMYLANLNVMIAEDYYTISKPQFRYTGSLIRMQKVSKVFSFTIGIAYSYVFGNGLPLPVLGGRVSVGKRSSFNFMLPFNISYGYRLGEQNRLIVFLRPAGGINNIANRGQFEGYPDVMQLRQRVLHLGALVSVAVTKNIKIIPEAGINSKRKLTFAEPGEKGKDYDFGVKSNAGFYFRIALNMRFGVQPYHGENDAVNYLMDNGVNEKLLDED